MLPSRARLSRRQFTEFLENKGFLTVFNQLGTFKYTQHTGTSFSVVTSSKHEKKAVLRNKLRRRIYATISITKPQVQGILYVSKQSYTFSYPQIKNLVHDLLAKAQKNTH